MKHYRIMATAFLFGSCNNQIANKQPDAPFILLATPQTDTIFLLSGIDSSGWHQKELTDSVAQQTLYTYFKTKGYYPPDNIPTQDQLTDNMRVSFNKSFMIALNGIKNKYAIISYWLTPPYANGHCWQPHKAIIAATRTGYIITNEEVIPENFTIDSVLNNHGEVTLYGYDYDCENRKIVKYIRASIQLEY